MSVLDSIKEKAKADVKHILLPEGSEERTVQAARILPMRRSQRSRCSAMRKR